MVEYTGVHGAITIAAAPVAISEFSIKIDRGVASHARSGEWSDLNAPGKLTVTGTINRIMIDNAFLGYVADNSGSFDIIATLDTDAVTLTANNCIITSGEFKFTDANEIVSDPITFTMRDPDADLTIA